MGRTTKKERARLSPALIVRPKRVIRTYCNKKSPHEKERNQKKKAGASAHGRAAGKKRIAKCTLNVNCQHSTEKKERGAMGCKI